MLSKKYSIVRKLSNRNLKMHKLRNFLMVMIIVCLTMLVCSLEILSSSTYKNMERYYLEQNGNTSQFMISNVPENKLVGFENDNIEELGKSIYVGNAINKAFNNRPSEIRYADNVYAEYALSLPTKGRMPEKKNEIAVDSTVLEDLGKSKDIGSNITIEWNDTEGKKRREIFEVVGIWEGNDICSNRKLWVSSDIVNGESELCFDMAFNLKSEKYSEKEVTRLVDELEIEEENVISNWVYSDSVQSQIKLETLVYKIGIILILICGFLIIYNVIGISVVSDRKLYGRIKTLGSTPAQVRFSVFYQYMLDTLVGVPVGLVMGYFLGSLMVPKIIIALGSELFVYAGTKVFISAAILVITAVLIAAIRPAYQASSIDPSDLLSEENNLNFSGKTHRRSPGLPALYQLSLSNFGRYLKRNVIAIILLTVGLVSLSCVYVINHSFDINKYMAEIAISDVTITEQTLVETWGEYNPKGNSIPQKLLNDLEETGGIVERGNLYSQDIELQASQQARDNVIEYYEQNGSERLKYMEQDVNWTEGYNTFKETNTCVATVFGMDGLVNDNISSKERIVKGTVDKEKFLSGDYVIAQGYLSGSGNDILQPTYDVGEKVVLKDKEFTVMAIAEAAYPVTEGKVNSGAEFNMTFFIPSDSFLEMFPENTPRKLFLNIGENKENEVESVLEPYIENGMSIETEKTIKQHYENEAKSATLLQNLVSFMIWLIGIVNFINVIVISTTARKKEFAMMQSIGMTKRQLKNLLIMEGLNISVITLIFSYFLSLVVICGGISTYLKTQWTSTYHFSITPLLIATPILILLPIVVSVFCFNHMQKTEIIERLQDEDELGTV